MGKARYRVVIAFVLSVVCVRNYAQTPAKEQNNGPRIEVSFSREISATPLDGHILVLISNNDKDEPRFQIKEEVVESQQAFGIDVDQMAPGRPVAVDESTVGYPAETLAKVPASDYWIQAVLNIYETFHLSNGHTVKLPPDKGEGQHWQVKPGNLYSTPQKIHFDPKSSTLIKISLTKKIPPVEEQAARVDSLLDWHPLAKPHEPADNRWVKHIKMQSEMLTKFWGRPTFLGATVLLPEGWGEHPDARYPLVVEQDHFHRDLPGFRTEPPAPGLDGEELRRAQGAYKFFQDWTSGRMPRVILLTIQHPTPYFDDSYAVNSASQGPYGAAITQELIPAVEKQFHAIGQGWARVVMGGSTGGWEALASQIFYPDYYNGAWVFCPDVVDFRAYGTSNLYADKNAYFASGVFAPVSRAEERQADGVVQTTMEQVNRYEFVLGTHGRSGEQFDIWQAVFSPAGEDGYPKPIFDKRTGEIDQKVAEYWKEHYDLSHILERDWKILGPKLAGKLHFTVGEADTWYLDRGVHLLQDFLEKTTDPYYHGTFDFGVRKPHCYTGNYDPQVGLHQHYLPEMVKHIEQTAPKGADVKSWKY